MIRVLEQGRTFHLATEHTSMIFHAMPSGHMMSLYWGSRVEDDTFSLIATDIKKASYLCGTDGIKDFRLEQYPVLYPSWGNPDLRNPAFQFSYDDGSRMTDLRFFGYRQYQGKNKLKGLPSVLSQEAGCLELMLRDSLNGVEVTLVYGVFESYDAITQSVKVTNGNQGILRIERLMSGCFSFLDDRYDAVTLNGAWARECHVSRQRIRQGSFRSESLRGASGHGQNPFLALAEPETGEDTGNVWAMNLVYSGGFEADIEVDMHQNTRFMMGIQSFGFSWRLNEGESFISPEAVLIHSGQGLGAMSRSFHRLYRECLLPLAFRSETGRKRPILINNWEATYFDFDKKKLLDLADEAVKLGIECFVLDDGWFGRRNSDEGSLGDWTENREKLGGSLAELAEEIRSRGLEFGLWFEPEMVSPDSDLYRSRPDWAIQVQGRPMQLARNQMVLDISCKEVQDYIIESVDRILKNVSVSYIKWDMNRNITEWSSCFLPDDRQKELGHRYILGLYRILEELTLRHKEVLFEGCAGGGGRFDPGMLFYMPQIWTSDDTDALERLDIQFGTSYIYPSVSMGCHVSACPNHITGRTTPLFTRGLVAMQGNLGYELDLTSLDEEEKREILRQTDFYKRIREIIWNGELYRLKKEGNERAFLYLSKDGRKGVVSFVQILARANTVPKRLKLKGLIAEALYRVKRVEGMDSMVVHGSFLMNIGLDLKKHQGDFQGEQWLLNREEDFDDCDTGK